MNLIVMLVSLGVIMFMRVVSPSFVSLQYTLSVLFVGLIINQIQLLVRSLVAGNVDGVRNVLEQLLRFLDLVILRITPTYTLLSA